MLALVMLLADVGRELRRAAGGADLFGEPRHLGNRLKRYRVVDCVPRR